MEGASVFIKDINLLYCHYSSSIYIKKNDIISYDIIIGGKL